MIKGYERGIFLEKKQKLTELFLLTSFLCCFVVLIHTSSEGVTKLMIGSWQHKIFFMFNKALSFVVPGFVFLSGLKLTYSYQQKSFDFFYFMKKRFLKILIPYIFWYIVYYRFLTSLGFMEEKTIQQHIFSFIMGDLISPFYFVTIIFQFYLLFGLFLYFIRKYKSIYVFIASAIIQYIYLKYIYIPYDDRFFMTYIVYFALGCVMSENLELFKIKIQQYSILIYVCFIFLVYWHITHSYNSSIEGIVYKNWRMFTCLFSISAILTFYHISYSITQKAPKWFLSIFKAIDESSFYIFLGHCYVLYSCNEHWFQVGVQSIFRKFMLNSVIVFFISFFVSFLYVLCKKKWCSIYKKV